MLTQNNLFFTFNKTPRGQGTHKRSVIGVQGRPEKWNCKWAQRAFWGNPQGEESVCKLLVPTIVLLRRAEGSGVLSGLGRSAPARQREGRASISRKESLRCALLEYLLGLGWKFLLLGILYWSIPHAQKSTQSMTCNSEWGDQHLLQEAEHESWKHDAKWEKPDVEDHLFVWFRLCEMSRIDTSLKTRQISGCLGLRSQGW